MKPSTSRKRRLQLEVETVKLLTGDQLTRVAGGESNGCDPTTTNRPSWCCHPP